MADPQAQAAITNAGQHFGDSSVGVQGCPLLGPVQVAPRDSIAAWLSFHPIQFPKNENPADENAFTVQPCNIFPTNHLLGDGRGKALIVLKLIAIPHDTRITPTTALATAAAGWHGGVGQVVLELSNPDAGALQRGAQRGPVLRFPISELPSGLSPTDKDAPTAILFTAGKVEGDVQIGVRLENVKPDLDYVTVPLVPNQPKREGFVNGVATGVRAFGRNAEGWDALKAQWYLRRFKFKAHTVLHPGRNTNRPDWSAIADIPTSGKVTQEQAIAFKDFRLVALSRYRNRTQRREAIVFDGDAQELVDAKTAVEMARWYDQTYTVECFYGVVDLQIPQAGGGQDRKVTGSIAYGVVHDDSRPIGNLEIDAAVGASKVSLLSGEPGGADDAVDVAAALRSSIRLHLDNDLFWRLRDADPKEHMNNPHLHQRTLASVRDLLVSLRRRHTHEYSTNNSFDVTIALKDGGYRSFDDQSHEYAKGRTAPSTVKCGCTYPNTDNVPIPVGQCQLVTNGWHHVFGKPVTHARAGHSWHNFGVAFDIWFYRADLQNEEFHETCGQLQALRAGAPANGLKWGGLWQGSNQDPPHVQAGTVPDIPSDAVRQAFSATRETLGGDERAAASGCLGATVAAFVICSET